jgi:hypothetical protein
MIALFLMVLTLVVACAAWQYLPVFRWVLKWTLLLACISGLCLVIYLKHLADQDEAANQRFFQQQALGQQIDRSVAQGICEGVGPDGGRWIVKPPYCPPQKSTAK